MNNSTIFYLLITGIVLATGTTVFFLAGTTPQTMTSDVVLYLPMMSDSSNSTYTKDWSMYDNNNTVSGATYTQFSTKNNNFTYGSYSFDGVNDYIDAGVVSTSSNGVSVNVWINPGFSTNPSTIFNMGLNNGPYHWLFYSAGYTTFAWRYWNGTASKSLGLNSAAFTYNNWTMVTIVHDYINKNISIYINGVLKQSVLHTDNVSIVVNETFYLGRYNSPSGYYNGSISQAMLFNRSLNASEISTLYNSTKTIFQSDNMSAYNKFDNTIAVSSAQSVWLPFRNDTSNSTYTKDYSSNSRSINIFNTTYDSPNGDYNFNGVNSYINMTYPVLTNQQTVSLWINPAVTLTSTSDPKYFVSKQNEFHIAYDYINGKLSYLCYNTSAYEGNPSITTTLTAGTWYHVVGIHNSTNARLYVNGTLVDTINVSMTSPRTLTGSLYIGIDYALTASKSFNGSIDNVQIFNISLTDAQVKTLYDYGRNPDYLTNSKPNLTSSSIKRFDNVIAKSSSYSLNLPMRNDTSNSTYTKDYSLNSFNGNIINAIYNSTDESYNFDGSTSYISLPTSTITTYGTASFWFKTNSTFTEQTIFSGMYNTYNVILYSGKIELCSPDSHNRTLLSYNDGNWHHGVVVTYPGVSYYVDGVLVSTEVGSAARISSQKLVGARYTGSTYSLFFNGSIDNVQLFPSVLTASQVKQLYDYGRNPDYLTDTKRYG